MGPGDQVDFMSDSLPVDQRCECVKRSEEETESMLTDILFPVLNSVHPGIRQTVVKCVLTAVTVTEAPPQTGKRGSRPMCDIIREDASQKKCPLTTSTSQKSQTAGDHAAQRDMV